MTWLVLMLVNTHTCISQTHLEGGMVEKIKGLSLETNSSAIFTLCPVDAALHSHKGLSFETSSKAHERHQAPLQNG